MQRVLVALALILPAGLLHAQSRAADEAAIRANQAAIAAALNHRDVAAFVSLLTPEADAVFGDSPLLVGREAIRDFETTDFPTWPSAMRITLTVTRIRFLAPDVALVDEDGHFTEGAVPANRATVVMMRQDGKWLQASVRVYAAQHP